MCITHCATVNADRWVFYKLKQGSDPIQSQTYYVKQVLFNGEGTVSCEYGLKLSHHLHLHAN